MAIADSFEAMTSTQFHREPMSVEKAAEDIVRGSGRRYDPKAVEAFRKVLPDLKAVREQYADSLGDMINLDFAVAPKKAAAKK